MSVWRKVYRLLTQREKKQALVLMFLMLTGALVEAAGISFVLPFVALVLDPSFTEKHVFLQLLYNQSGVASHEGFIIVACATLVAVFLLKNLFLFFICYFQNKFVAKKQIAMSRDLFFAYLHKPYDFFFSVNTADLQRNLNGSVSLVANGVFMNCLGLVSEAMVVLAIFFLLLVVDPISSSVAFVFTGVALVLSYWFSRRRAQVYSQLSTSAFANMIKWLNQGIGSIKEIKILGRESFFLEQYVKSSSGCADATAKHQVLLAFPRIYFETVTVSAMVLIVIINVLQKTSGEVLMATLGLFAMAAFRLMPAMNRIATMLTTIRFGMVQLDIIFDDLADSTPNLHSIQRTSKQVLLPLNNEIQLNNVGYRYPKTTKDVFNEINLTIPRGSSIGLIGSSGAGKTTLVDLILGLLQPTQGSITVDGIDIRNRVDDWRANLGYIPQQIYLIDDTIAHNVALGIPDSEIDIERMLRVLEIAQIKEYIDAQIEGVNTQIGERGICLSGGQRQRIGIARALYHNPQVLVLDEATSALDNETEKSFMDAIELLGGQMTIIAIAHRQTSLRHCDAVYQIDSGRIKHVQLQH